MQLYENSIIEENKKTRIIRKKFVLFFLHIKSCVKTVKWTIESLNQKQNYVCHALLRLK